MCFTCVFKSVKTRFKSTSKRILNISNPCSCVCVCVCWSADIHRREPIQSVPGGSPTVGRHVTVGHHILEVNTARRPVQLDSHQCRHTRPQAMEGIQQRCHSLTTIGLQYIYRSGCTIHS